MINTNLKTQVQARINAINSATTLPELFRIQTQSSGLGCDTTLLNSEIQNRLAALNGSTTLTDLTIAALLAEGKSDRAYYQVPFAVAAGDKLFIDAFGQVKNKKLEPSAFVSAEFSASFSVFTASAIPAGHMTAAQSYSQFAAVINLANGNRLVLRAFRTSVNDNSTRLRAIVTDANGEAILSEQTTGSIDGESGLVTSSAVSVRFVAIRETSANVFRVFCTTAPSGGDGFSSQLGYFMLAYNSTSHAVTASAGASINNRGAGVQWSVTNVLVPQTEQYHLLHTSANQLFVLNTATSSVAQVASLASSVTAINKGLAGGGWGAVISAGNRLLVKADNATSQALPANLAADGCFGAANQVELLSGRLWVAIAGTSVKLVSFTSDYTGCSIYTLGSVAAAGAIATIFKQGDTYTIGLDSGSVFAFTWTGSAAPTDFRPDAGFRLTDRENFSNPQELNNLLRRINHTDSIFCTGAVFGSGNQVRLMCLRVSPAEYMAYDTQEFATCLTSAAANGFAEIELADNTRVSPGATTTYSAKVHQNLLTVLKPRGQLDRIYQGFKNSGSDITKSPISSEDLDLANSSVAARQISLNNAAVLLDTGSTYLLNFRGFTVLTPLRRVQIEQDPANGLAFGVIDVKTAALFANINSSVTLLNQQVNE